MNRLFPSNQGSLLPRRSMTRLAGIVIGLLMVQSAFAFYPTSLILELLGPGNTGDIFVKAPPGESGTVLVSSISTNPPGMVQVNTTLPKSGAGSVTISFTALGLVNGADTLINVTFYGSYKGQDGVQGSSQILIRAPIRSSGQSTQFATAGDPVNTANGEYYGSESVDLSLGGPMPLFFARYVGSNLESDGIVQGHLGENRSHNFAARMTSPATGKQDVILPNGRRVSFEKKATKWILTGPLDVPYALIELGAGVNATFVLGDPHTQYLWTFDNTGKLTKIEDGRGNTHTLSYAGTLLDQVSDGLGRSLSFDYDGSNQIITVTAEPGTRVVSIAYTGDVLTSATDQGGHVTQYGNAGGLPTSVTRPEGNVLFTQSYTDGKVTSQTERGTDTSTLNYTPPSTTFTDPTAATQVDTYDADGRLTSHADEAGKAITMSYDSAGRRNSVTDRLGDKTTIAYHAPSGLPSVITNTEGRTTTMTYKSRSLPAFGGMTFHDLSKITFADGTSRSFTYDTKGNLTQVTDQTGKMWKFTYNIRGQVLTMINPLGGLTTFNYDNFGNLVFRQDPDAGAASFGYDLRHRLELITLPGGATIEIDYDNKDRITQVTDERGKIHTFAYDTNNRMTTVIDPDTKTTTFGYDVLDRVIELIDRNGQDTDLVYDSRRLLASITDRNGNTTSTQYDARRRPEKAINAAAKEWLLGYDDEGLVTSMTNPENETISIKRNRLGSPVEISNSLGHTTRLTRDTLQRVTQVFDPLGRQTSFAYDKAGLLISVTEQVIGSGKYTRDGLGNITKITDPNGGTWSYVYLKSGRLASTTDPLGKKWIYAYHPTTGHLQTITNPDNTTILFSYDAAGNLTGRQHGGPDIVQSYDNLGRLATVDDTTISGDQMAFTYDAEGRLTNGKQNNVDFNATYDNGGRLTTVSYMDGAVVVTYQYDSLNRLTQVTDNVTTAQVGFSYDDTNRLTTIERSNNIDTTYTFDAAGRLTGINDGPLLSLNYTLNAAGEIVAADFAPPANLVPAVTAATNVFKFGKAAQITNTSFVYDVRGRLTASPGKTYAWDGAGRLTNANGVLLAYNGVGDVISRTENANVTSYYHHYAISLAPIVYEDLPSGSDRAYVWTPNGRLLYSIEIATSEALFYHFDNVGSTLALTNSAGQPTDAYVYGPSGELLDSTGSSTQPFTYVGAFGVRKEGTLFQMRARYYDPSTAHFLSRDPLPPRLTDVKSLNPYQYAQQNPLSFIDPQGTTALCHAGIEWFAPHTGLFFDFLLDGKRATKAAEEDGAHPMFRQTGMSRPPGAGGCDFVGSPPGSRFPHPLPTRGGFKIADNESPRPQDRVFFSYNYFGDNSIIRGPIGGIRREVVGFEKTFLDNSSSVDLRLPFDSNPPGGGIDSAAMGDGNLTLRNAILSANSANGGDVFSAGLSVTVPPPGISGNTIAGNTFGGNLVSGTIANGTVTPNSPDAPPAPAPINPNTNLPKGINPGLAYFAGFDAPPPPRD